MKKVVLGSALLISGSIGLTIGNYASTDLQIVVPMLFIAMMISGLLMGIIGLKGE